jgi:glutamate/tyrosine decarboxylase-like PLP-dependent enzyme
MRDERQAVEETLDPEDWTGLRAMAHRMVDDAIDHVAGVRDRAVWQDMPEGVRARLREGLPVDGAPMEAVYREYRETSAAYPMGNIHPRFWGWFMGAGNMAGALGDFLAAIDGSNLGGGNTGPALLDRQVTGWLKEMMGFPAEAGAMLTSGGSVANMVGLVVARNVMSGIDLREAGVRAMTQPLRFYGSEQMHSCHQKAMEVLGLGNAALRRIPVDGDLRMDMGALARAVAEDRAAGWKPACVIASAGTVNTGSVDPLEAVADFCQAEGLWYHVDGCIGALLNIAPQGRALVEGLARADSLALDPHKWMHAPFVAGCALVKDRRAHFGAFTLHGEYLQEQARGLAAAEFLADYGVDLSRGFQALKVWMALKHHGVAKFGRLIDQNIAQAAHLAARVRAEPMLDLMAPQVINIVCFRYAPAGMGEDDLRRVNTEIMLRMQEDGTAVLTDTTIGRRHCLRVAITNHRTKLADLDMAVDAVLRIGAEVAG